MPIDQTTAAHLISKLTNDVTNLGDKANYSLGVTSNAEAVALEYLIAQIVHQAADIRLKAARKAAVAADVLQDYEQFPLDTGKHTVFAGDAVQLHVDVRAPGETLDAKQLRRELLLAGVGIDVIDSCFKEASRQKRAAHVVRAALKVNE